MNTPAKWDFAEFCLVRVPRFPLRQTRGVFYGGWNRNEIDQLDTTETRLVQWLQDEVFHECLELTSPQLATRLQSQWSDKVQRPKAAITLAKYVLRGATRATPYGTWATVSLGKVNSSCVTTVQLGQLVKCRATLEYAHIGELADRLSCEPELKYRVGLSRNPTLYPDGDGWRYWELRLGEDGEQRYELARIAGMDVLTYLLEQATSSIERKVLESRCLSKFQDVDPADLTSYVDELVAQRVLVSDLEPNVVGDEPFARLASEVAGRFGDHKFARWIRQIESAVQELSNGRATVSAASKTVVEALLQMGVSPAPAGPLQIDATRPEARVEVNRSDLDDLALGLAQLVPHFEREAEALTSFTAEFRRRFDTNAVGLLEALDPDRGIDWGAKAPTEFGLPYRFQATPSAHVQLAVVARNQVELQLQRQYAETLRSGQEEIDLEPILAKLKVPTPKQAWASLGVVVSPRYSSDRTAIEWALKYAYGPSSGRLLARFAYAIPSLQQVLESQYRLEECLQERDAVTADIAYVPTDHLGNIAARPICAEYSIEVRGKGAVESKKIKLTDLFLRLEGNSLVLFSASLGKRVIPRLSNAHNFHSATNLPVYRLLAHLQGETDVLPKVLWGSSLDAMTYFPRLRFRNVLVAPQTWRIIAADLLGIISKGNVDSAETQKRIRDRWKLPRQIEVVTGDNFLALDLESEMGMRLLEAEARKNEMLWIEEQLIDSENAVAVDELGEHFACEMVFSISRCGRGVHATEEKRQLQTGRRLHAPDGADSYLRSLGNPVLRNWLYLRLYIAESSIDRFIATAYASWLRLQRTRKRIERGFFIRYSDPNSHIRVRVEFVRGAESSAAEIVRDLEQHIHESGMSGLVHELEIAEYRPEIERYGGTRALHLAEGIFHTDSEATTQLLAIAEDGKFPVGWRLHSCVDSAIRTLQLLLPELADVRRTVDRICSSYMGEFGLQVEGRRELGAMARAHFERWQSESADVMNAKSRVNIVLDERDALVKELLRDNEAVQVIASFSAMERESFAADIVHMCQSRLIRGDLRWQELVVYDLVRRRLLVEHHRGLS